VTNNQYPNSKAEPIAVVAIGSIFPGRGDTTGFWRDIVEGVDTFTSVPGTHWLTDDYYDSNPATPDRTYGLRGAFIPATSFDPLSFGVPPNALSTTDTAQLLALVAARSVLDDIEREIAGPLDKSRASVILGVAATTELVGQMMGRLQRPAWIKGMREAGLDEVQAQDIADRISSNFVEWRETTFPGLLGNVVAGRIANRLDFGGSNYVTDAACASSLSAMQIALHELQSGDSDLVLTGGVDALNDIFMYMCFSKTPALSPTGDCRPLSADADGTMLGEGVGMLALRRLSDAERDGNRIHAIVTGLGGGSDGRSTAVYAPLASGQERTLTRAYRKAGYSPATVELVEAHGTGTVAGDRTEIEALHSVFDPESQAASPWCALGSVKAQIGHTKAAAGAAGLLKVIGGLSRKILPPTIKVRQPADALCQDTPFYLSIKARPWIRGGAHPRRASVSSFGFGGSNFHVTLEEYTGKNAVQPTRVMPAELFLLSASTQADLGEQVNALTREVKHEDDLARIATASWHSFNSDHEHRAAIVAETPEHLVKLCAKLVAVMGQSANAVLPSDRHIHYCSGKARPGKLALLFSGQGSQYVGMGADIAMAFPQARAVWDSACDVPATAGLKLHDLAFPPTSFTPESTQAANSRLTDMRHAQPAIAAMALSQLALIKQLGIRADMQAGHSFGEVMALHNAGVFDAPTALTIACDRADAMSLAAADSTGSMLAVQASSSTVNDLLAGIGYGITLANDNATEQVVLSGNKARLEQAASRLSTRGIQTQFLPVAAAFHSPQVSPAVQPFAQKLVLQALGVPTTAVYANSTASTYPSDKNALVKVLSEQIGKPVLFRQSLLSMYAAGATLFLEVGPGSVLTNLVRKTFPSNRVTAIALDNKHGNGTTSLLCAIGQLATSGVAVDIDNLYAGLPAPLMRKKPGKHSVEILGSNYQKPYPPQDAKASVRNPTRPKGASAKTTPLTQTLQAGRSATATTPADTAAVPEETQTVQASSGKKANSARVTDPEKASAQAAETAPLYAHAAQAARVARTQYKNNSMQILNKVSAAHKSSHQLSSAAQSSMAKQDHSSGPNGTGQSAQPQFTSAATQPNGALDSGGVASTPVSSTLRGALCSEVSARHAEYMAAMTSAHQTYLSMAAEMIGGVEGSALNYSVEPIATTRHITQGYDNGIYQQPAAASTMSDTPASAAPTSLNGHSPLNGASRSNGTAAPVVQSARVPTPTAEPASSGTSVMTSAPTSGHSQTPTQAPASTQAPTPATNGATAPPSAEPRISTDLVRELIAEKTGYPVEMIEDDMDLSGELGIDSIKQVEVLSALRLQVPAIKDVGSADMGQLRTIRQIADFFG